MNLFSGIFYGKRVLITGHTGFKGSWLALWLNELGANVTGVSLANCADPNHWALLKLDMDDRRSDIRDYEGYLKILKDVRPDAVFHMAAQSLVRHSYCDPLETWSTNVMGTANVIEACRHVNSVRAIVIVSSDKCYQNYEISQGYREGDRLGGKDPYSASKAAVEILSGSYRDSFLSSPNSPMLATVRAGNVVGGGDFSCDRLIPDLVRSIRNDEPLEIRSPDSIRPWQHVLEPLSGYLMIAEKLLLGEKYFSTAWNFGPSLSESCSVMEVLEIISKQWPEVKWRKGIKPHLHEASLLYLDSSKALNELLWKNVWDINVAMEKTAEWYKSWMGELKVSSSSQLYEYIHAAKAAKVNWANQ